MKVSDVDSSECGDIDKYLSSSCLTIQEKEYQILRLRLRKMHSGLPLDIGHIAKHHEVKDYM